MCSAPGAQLYAFRHTGPAARAIFSVKMDMPGKEQPGAMQQAGLHTHRLMIHRHAKGVSHPGRGYGRIMESNSYHGLFSVSFDFTTLNFCTVF